MSKPDDIEVRWGESWIKPLSAQRCKDGSWVVELIDRRGRRVRLVRKNPKRQPWSQWRYADPVKFVSSVAQYCVARAHAGKL